MKYSKEVRVRKSNLDLEDVEAAYEEGTDDSTEFNADEEQANEI